MKLIEYADAINQLVAAGHGNCDVVYSIDEEGNVFSPVCYHPSYGKYSGNDQLFLALSGNSKEDEQYQEELDMLNNPVDAVCVN